MGKNGLRERDGETTEEEEAMGQSRIISIYR